ncbi:MAG: D-alanyl-D-alanine carboxypeptidase family protein [Bacilli bacterium]
MDKSLHNVQVIRRRRPPIWNRVMTIMATMALVCATALPPDSAYGRTKSRVQPISVPQILTREPDVSAEAACLIDVATGRILYAKRADKRMRIASLTKIITAWIAVRSGKLDKVVTVTGHAVRQEGSSVYLGAGEQQTLRNLVYAMMLRSGNDAAMAIAEFLGGNEQRFAAVMNEEVHKLGLTHSHFVNPHGLDHPEHYSTAHDMAVITAAALHNPLFRQIVSSKFFAIPWSGQKWDRKLRNKNKLLWMMDGADGVKTGYTKLSGRCLASSSTRAGRQVALVVLRDGNDWVDSARLLTYGLTAYERRNVIDLVHLRATAPVRFGRQTNVALRAAGDVSYVFHRDETAAVEAKIIKLKPLSAPVRKGQPAGVVEYVLHGQKLGRARLLTVEAVKAKGIWGRLRDLFL